MLEKTWECRVFMAKYSFILASGSPRRKDLLNRLGASFKIIPADVEEIGNEDADPEWMVRENAEMKARWVADKHPEEYVLGSDTTVHLDGRILNKPVDMNEARSMLQRMSGRTHFVYTAFSIQHVKSGLLETEGVRSEVTFKSFDDATIDSYFLIVNPLDKAGAYGIQEGMDLIIDSFKGSHSNIMGLPLDETKAALERHKLLL
ncbi:Maf family protein [Puniceicoccaceae bacterium K14]|nr:Maf family protein [Puniceicoccaceae bacterium K14]